MRDLVLDASVVLKWFDGAEERQQAAARSLREQYLGGRVRILAPRLLMLEVLNVVGRRWRWSGDALGAVASSLDALRFELLDPQLAEVARWTAQGLSAYDAAYVVVAEAAGASLVTDDAKVLATAPRIARPLADVA
jgi:predicted nucleic acid-binding protein